MKLKQFINKLVKWSKYASIVLLFSSSVLFAAPDNSSFKEWCGNTFTSGTEIYEAYRTITFDIEYIKELGMDEWQHPKETMMLKGGDCEDAMLLFSSLIPSDLENVRIVWGRVYTMQGTVFKHVWGNVISKTGNKYVLLNNKRFGWDGLPSELQAQQVLLKREIFVSVSQKVFNKVIDYFKDVEDFNSNVFKEVIEFVPDSNIHSTDLYELYNIFEKIYGVFSTKIEKS